MVRIALVVISFPKLSENFIANKFFSLFDLGWDVHVVCNQSGLREWDHFPQLKKTRELKKRVHQTWPTYPWWLVLALFPLALLKCVFSNPKGLAKYFFGGWKIHKWQIFKRFYIDYQLIALKPDLIHFEFGVTATSRSDLGKLLECKQVVSFRGYDLYYSGLEQADFYQGVWENSDAFHFLGHDLYQRALKRGCPPDKPIALIAPAINNNYFKPVVRDDQMQVGFSQRPFRILSVGRLEWVKGYEFALQAMYEFVKRGVECEYRIIGAGAYLEPLLFTLRELGLERIVTFLGELPREKVVEQLRWADVFLHAGVSEGFCNAVLEAQSMKVPVICTDAGGLPENVVDGVTGFIIPKRNPEAMADKLLQLAESPDLRGKMGLAGRKRVIAEFKLTDQISKYDRFYKQVLNFHED